MIFHLIVVNTPRRPNMRIRTVQIQKCGMHTCIFFDLFYQLYLNYLVFPLGTTGSTPEKMHDLMGLQFVNVQPTPLICLISHHTSNLLFSNLIRHAKRSIWRQVQLKQLYFNQIYFNQFYFEQQITTCRRGPKKIMMIYIYFLISLTC